ncbi:conserved hypothetical protein; putative exported protein [Bradyrhizobium sp. ORS 278]|uniref:hypothetical protein n=1 Tax=Bradyrhizobium sp. (strain ORS 278) TaxID=114615 RepID=UPI0001507B67|nr:hypothetical protein [Bradyrhizobium sp. ORS 278]CAL75407.1 conserved hypothetical protein; putative exported protein [Bradyrhizobium sp. ORS 278]
MSLGLTRNMLMVAGRLLVLAYLICVLSPGVALAFTRGAAPCLDEASVAVAHDPIVHHRAAHAEMSDGTMTSQMHAHAHDHQADAGDEAQPVAPAPSHHDHAKIPGPCCAMMCAVGLTASLPAVTLPSRVAVASESAGEVRLPGRTPPRLDRPPIVLI